MPTAVPRIRSVRSAPGATIRSPASEIDPPSPGRCGRASPTTARARVVFPLPDSPTTPTIWPRPIARSTSSSSRRSPSESRAVMDRPDTVQQFTHRRLFRGSWWVSSASPSRFTSSTRTVMARPGKNAIHQAWLSSSWPEASIEPQLSSGRHHPEAEEAQRALDQDRRADLQGAEGDDRAGEVGQDVPEDDAGLGRADGAQAEDELLLADGRVAERVTRAQAAQPVSASTRNSTGSELPRLAMIASAMRMNGRASWASMRMEMTRSTQPRSSRRAGRPACRGRSRPARRPGR